MWVVELRFGKDAQRLAARPAHRQVLECLQRDGRIAMAGPFSDDSGALLVFDVATREQLQRLLDDDPYYATPGVELRAVREWTPIFPGRPMKRRVSDGAWPMPDLADLRQAVTRFAAMPRPEASLRRLRQATGDQLDLTQQSHLDALLVWLNAWGCRLEKGTEARASFDASLTGWWPNWFEKLPTAPLMTLEDGDIQTCVDAFAALSALPANAHRRIQATAAAKILHVLRPAGLLPWDRQIALAMHGSSDPEAFGAHLRWGRSASIGLGDEAAARGLKAADVPAQVGRPDATIAKLLDEYLYVTITRGA